MTLTAEQPVVQACSQCQQPHLTQRGNPSCRAHSRRTGQPCGRDPMIGQKVCATHGGRARHSVEAAARRAAQAEVKAVVAIYGIPRDADPRDALAEEVARTLGAIDWLGAQIQAAKPTSAAELAVSVAPYATEWRWERTHLRQLCRDVVGLGIADRGSRVAEQVGGLLVQALDRLLDDLELNEVQRARLVEVVPAALRQISQ